MKKLLISFFTLILLSSMMSKAGASTIHFNKIRLDSNNNYIFANRSQTVSLTDYYVSFDGEKRENLENCKITGVKLENNSFSFSEKGIHTLKIEKESQELEVFVFIKDQSEEKYVVFEDDFTEKENLDFLSDYQIIVGDKSHFSLDEGLKIGNKNVSTKLYLNQRYKNLKSFDIETDFTITEASNDSRWIGILFRTRSAGSYYQMAVRQNAMAANGIEVSKALNNDETWDVPAKTAYTEKIDANKSYKARVSLSNTSVTQYINDTPIQSYDGYTEYTQGNIGLQARNAQLKVKNIRVTLDENQVKLQSKSEYLFPDVYEAETEIINPPTVMQKINSEADLNKLSQPILPQSIFVNVDDQLNVIGKNNQILTSIDEINRLTYGKMIINYNTKNEMQALKLAGYLKENGILDFFITNSDPNILEKVKKANSNSKNIYNYASSKESLNSEDLKQIYRDVALSYASVLILDQKYINNENVRYFQIRMISVFSDESTGDSKENDYRALYSGSNGILTSDFIHSYTLLKSFEEKTYTRRPVIIGHRGLPAKYTENTIEGCIAAVDSGVEMVELDVHLTADKKLVVFHNFTTDGYTTLNGKPVSFDIARSNFDDIRAATLKDMTGKNPNLKIPTLEEFLAGTKHKNFVYNIELKSWVTDLVDYVKPVLDQFDLNDRIVLTSFDNTGQLPRAKAIMPYYTQGVYTLSGVFTPSLTETIKNVNAVSTKFSTGINPSYLNVTYEKVRALQHRGITVWPWTVTEKDFGLFDSLYGMNVAGITMDDCSYTQEMRWGRLIRNEYDYQIYLDQNQTNSQNIQIQAEIYDHKDFLYKMAVPTKILSNNNTELSLAANGKIISALNAGYEYLGLSHKTSNMAGENINYLIGLVKVNVSKEKEPEIPPLTTTPTSPQDKGESGCKKKQVNSGDLLWGILSVLTLSGAAVYLLKRK